MEGERERDRVRERARNGLEVKLVSLFSAQSSSIHGHVAHHTASSALGTLTRGVERGRERETKAQDKQYCCHL